MYVKNRDRIAPARSLEIFFLFFHKSILIKKKKIGNFEHDFFGLKLVGKALTWSSVIFINKRMRLSLHCSQMGYGLIPQYTVHVSHKKRVLMYSKGPD